VRRVERRPPCVTREPASHRLSRDAGSARRLRRPRRGGRRA
jgi:hypothetical protein